ncbi:SprT-like domain-containing protein [Hydrocarboniphaga sp.]|uniref:SprT family zinc-dependent metalloprotease n=1 Tax=Hydrocarboniphaga sp. TaxID=2033016 RepID=UPI003D0ADD07
MKLAQGQGEPAHGAEPWRRVPLVRDHRGVEWEQGAIGRNPQRVRARLEQAVDHWIALARQMPAFACQRRRPIPRPTVIYDLRGTIAGMAVSVREGGDVPDQAMRQHPEQWMRVHPELLIRYPLQMIQQTVPHEIAHLVVDWYWPNTIAHHGAEWAAVMRYFGRQALAYHQMELARRMAPSTRRNHELPLSGCDLDRASQA